MNYDHESGTPLVLALTNSDTTQRVATANRLLDDSADVSRRHPLHVLLARNEHDFAVDARLVERLLDAGVEWTRFFRTTGHRWRRWQQGSSSAMSPTPFYDVLLARPDLDLLRQSKNGHTVLGNLRKWSAKRAELVIRAEQTLTDRGIPVPPPGQ